MLDRNQNGVIDQEEINMIPSFVRDRMKDRGFEYKAGQSVDEIRNQFQERMGRMREEYERNRGNGGDDNNSRGNRSTPAPAFKPRNKERITVDLPKEYSDVDSDLDGQIGLYEWIVVRREDLELFDDIDRNLDGLLTPKELVAWDKLSKETGETTLTAEKRERLVIVGGTASSARGADRGSSDRESRWGSRGSRSSEEVKQRAQRSFGWLDRDRNGQLSADELASSRRTRWMFENAGIEFVSMSQDQFSKNYAKALEKVHQSR